ncbi:2-hydroxyacid dehydrogenase [Metabacillus iocasae]|uniref:Glyoxylate reductase n=1 Tax=Priestia iocasae TaxID=2291674 RepID=A0ABS2R014_9BACI|nr:D-glycerate dehydrogenase [Metabacillus iocasae]MBM7704602.1 glyoxylate reductase [Metabacillus iocasae]
MKPYVFITRKLPDELVKPLMDVAEVEMWNKEEEPVPAQLLREKANRATALLTMLSDTIDESLLDASPHLKVIANLAVGFDNIDVPVATKRNIVICNTPDVLSDTTADLTFGLLMATARRLIESANYVKEGKWQGWSPYLLAGHDIHHKTIGIVGMGKIGQALAKRATGFEMEILYHNRSRNEVAEQQLNATYCSFDDLLTKSDYVVCLTPLTNETKHLFNKQAFQKMKSSAIFVNASRGAVVDEEALVEALQTGDIAAAGLDVFTKEPIDVDHPLLSLSNVVALPHIGSASIETRTVMMKLCVENIIRLLQNQDPKTIVNKELLSQNC